MDSVLDSLRSIISNAKKSLSRPYSSDTVKEKRLEITEIAGKFDRFVEKKKVSAEEKSEFERLKQEAVEVLDLHTTRSRNNSLERNPPVIMANMEINELTAIVKLVPLFTGKKDDLHNFVTSLEIVSKTIPTTKQASFFNFIFSSRLDLKVQNRVKQGTVPTTVEELIQALRRSYKPLKSANSVLNELTSISQRGDNLMGFAGKIESLVAEVNELQIAEEGEASRASIIRANSRIAYNSFLNGLSDPQIIATIDASRVSTFADALEIAERASSRTKQRQVMFQKSMPRQNNTSGHAKTSGQCRKCGRMHGDRCPAEGKICNKCKKPNHFANKCLTDTNNSNPNNNRNNRNSNHSNYRGSNNRNSNYRNHQNNRNRNINQVENQGNSQAPETTHQDSPEHYE